MTPPKYLVFCSALALASAVAASARQGVRAAEVHGTIAALNASSITINAGTPVTLTVNSQTRVELNGQRASLSSLAVNEPAEAKFDPSTLVASRIEVETQAENEAENEAEDAHATGVVVSVDAAAGLLFLDTNGDKTSDLTLSLAPDARVELNGRALPVGQLGQLVGQTVRVEFNPTNFVATEVETVKAPASSSKNNRGRGSSRSNRGPGVGGGRGRGSDDPTGDDRGRR